jgi:hypothetical protein
MFCYWEIGKIFPIWKIVGFGPYYEFCIPILVQIEEFPNKSAMKEMNFHFLFEILCNVAF